MKHLIIIAALSISQATMANTAAITQVMDELTSQGAASANAENGKALWNKSYAGDAPFTERSCTSCHSDNLTTTGKHAKTGKSIKPLAPSVNKDSLTDAKKINKWFLRNCKWTLNRECTAQEKADILTFISKQ